jgi:recombination protein RecA
MALRFYASVRLDVRRIESLKQGDAVIGSRTRVTVKKNKVAPPFRVAEFDIMYKEGISSLGDLLDLGVEYDILSKRGAYFRFGEDNIGQGREAAKEYLRNNPITVQQIDGLIRAKAGLPGSSALPPTHAIVDDPVVDAIAVAT